MSIVDYWPRVDEYAKENPSQRYWQAAFNVLCMMRSDLSELIRGTEDDPFYAYNPRDPRVKRFKAFLRANW